VEVQAIPCMELKAVPIKESSENFASIDKKNVK